MKVPNKKILPNAAVARLMKKAGAERVSEDGAEEFRKHLEEYSVKLGERCWQLAKHSGRKTVKKEDVRLALE
ncbi:MAG TPA: histone family protein [Candidatus Nanoarchaeia archaeon]|nr:histone family protein [Candidatus Nanoarchaeia archaeon]